MSFRPIPQNKVWSEPGFVNTFNSVPASGTVPDPIEMMGMFWDNDQEMVWDNDTPMLWNGA